MTPRPCPYVKRAKNIARLSYSRQYLARYLAALDHSASLLCKKREIALIVQKTGHTGLIDWLRGMYERHPSVELHAALIAETLAWKKTRAQVYRNAAEITAGIPEIIEHGRAA